MGPIRPFRLIPTSAAGGRHGERRWPTQIVLRRHQGRLTWPDLAGAMPVRALFRGKGTSFRPAVLVDEMNRAFKLCCEPTAWINV